MTEMNPKLYVGYLAVMLGLGFLSSQAYLHLDVPFWLLGFIGFSACLVGAAAVVDAERG